MATYLYVFQFDGRDCFQIATGAAVTVKPGAPHERTQWRRLNATVEATEAGLSQVAARPRYVLQQIQQIGFVNLWTADLRPDWPRPSR